MLCVCFLQSYIFIYNKKLNIEKNNFIFLDNNRLLFNKINNLRFNLLKFLKANLIFLSLVTFYNLTDLFLKFYIFKLKEEYLLENKHQRDLIIYNSIFSYI